MASNLKKFVNFKFLRTCDLTLMRRLMSRYTKDEAAIDLAVFDLAEDETRDALREYFAGPENTYPAALTADLHRIADLGTQRGMRILLERAKAQRVALEPAPESEESLKADPKYVALRSFLDHRDVFDAASDLLALETTLALTELRGDADGVRPKLDQETKQAFEAAAKQFFASDMMGRYCRIGWYEDGSEVRIVVVHGTEIATEWVVEENDEKIISFRPVGTTVLAYEPKQGRLKVGGLPKAQRFPMADIFAETILQKPSFFGRDDACDLYTLDPVEQRGFGFVFDHRFDQEIRSVRIVEVQADRVASEKATGRKNRQWSVLIKDRHNALQRMGQVSKVSFGPDAYRLSHLSLRVEFDAETKRRPTVTVKISPPQTAAFKRELFEGRIMKLLERNGLCVERNPASVAVAAE